MILEMFKLKQDPFPIVPDGPVHNWAGREELREELVDLIKGVRARDIGVTEFAALYGEYGAGKSHALRYLKTLIDEDEDFCSLAIYLERPRVSAKLNFFELYKYVIRNLGRDKVKKYCLEIKQMTDLSSDELMQSAGVENVTDNSSFVEQAINGLPMQDRAIVKLLREGAEDASGVFDFLVGDKPFNNEDYSGKVDSDFMAAKVLSDLFRVLTSELRPGKRIFESVYLFLDEAEVLFDAKSTESEMVFSGLRELINGLPYRFGLLISFSAPAALIEAVISQHLLKRMTMPYIEVPMLDDDHAKEFLQAQLDNFRVDGSDLEGSFVPFEEEAIDFIIGNTTEVTPRNLFIQCKRVLERSIRRFHLKADDTISKEMAEQILIGYR